MSYRKKKGVDYTDTFSPAVRPETLRLFLALSIEHPDIEVEQLDIVTAYLYGELNEDMYMNTPKGEQPRSKVLKLLNSLHGLKHAPRNWNAKIDNFLVGNCGFSKIIPQTPYV